MFAAQNDLNSVIAEVRRAACEVGLKRRPGRLPPFVLQGNSIEDIERHEKKLGRAIPRNIAHLYQALEGVYIEGESISTGEETAYLVPLEISGWSAASANTTKIEAQWYGGQYYLIGKSPFGDEILFCENSPSGKIGAILLFDFYCINKMITPNSTGENQQYTSWVVLGDSLAHWLSRWAACGFVEFALAPKERWNVSKATECAFLEDHIRLNPTVQWARERLGNLKSLA